MTEDEEYAGASTLPRRLAVIAVALLFAAAGGWLVYRATRIDAPPHPYDDAAVTRIDPALFTHVERSDQAIALGPGLPVGLALDATGCLAVATDRDLRVWPATALPWATTVTGAPVAVPLAAGEVPSSVDVDPAGGFLVGLGDRLLLIDASGGIRQRWPGIGDGAWITAAARLAGHVYLADPARHTVWRCDPAGVVLGQIAGPGPGDQHWLLPLPSRNLDLFARDGELVVVNPGKRRLEIFDVRGEWREVIGRQGNGIEAFAGCHNPIAIAPYGDGVVTVEKGSQRVKVVDRRGGLVEVIAGPASFSAIDDFTDVADLAADDSRVLVLDVRRRCVRVFCRSIAKPDQTTSPPPIFQE